MTVDKRQVVTLEEETDAIVVRGGIRVEFNASGGIDLYSPVPVTIHPATNDVGKPRARAELRVGDKMPDGTIFDGLSPDTNKPLYATAGDAPLTYAFNQARKYAAALDAHGHKDWRVPTRGELNVLFENRAAIGGFNETGSYPAGWLLVVHGG